SRLRECDELAEERSGGGCVEPVVEAVRHTGLVGLQRDDSDEHLDAAGLEEDRLPESKKQFPPWPVALVFSRSNSTVFRRAMNGGVENLRWKSKIGTGLPPPCAMPVAP